MGHIEFNEYGEAEYKARSGPPVITFKNLNQVSLSIRASALVFEDPESSKLLSLIERVAPSDVTAFIMGETGTGKELVARHLHALSPRKHGPFAAINCGAFSESLVESELFGHEKGSFTGAVSSKQGWFESANGGTLFLDEIGDLPLSTQVKLLRVIQQREIVRVGSRKATPIDVRLVAATNVNLEDAVKAGRFREDLYYRINVVPIQIAPLRNRVGDILPLTEHFLSIYKNRLHTKQPTLASETIKLLHDYPWPGNIRELENVIHRALLVSDGNELRPRDLNLPAIQAAAGSASGAFAGNAFQYASNEVCTLDKALNEIIQSEPEHLYETVNRKLVLSAYAYCRQNQVQTARVLGISRNILRTLLKQFGVIQ
ncbi:sigma-54 interaction domain-containing protein [Methylotenera mobilis]|uniref:Sigma 54 interacting domain protein n=1 Tax=Methylotenera mobilis (strain JLW8 / ATCC BAA-1282 / DSM 17540) TaxID=583345 RepID=C6WYN3_METML|nr:sigma-54 dependent transcriptional regulator [Methylotenera mobilis]ACT47008.1 Sigma 54 interacting domain protein [Methylotenera mobilis JLW8]